MLEIADDVIIEEQEEKQVDDEKQWCVYMHISPSGKRYIGITSRDPVIRWGKDGKRYLEKKNDKYRHPAMANALLKYSNWDEWQHYILIRNITEEYAKIIEKCLIEIYQTRDYKYGYNCTDGGEGASGLIMSDDAKKKLSEKAKERLKDKTNHPMYGVHRYGENNPMYGKHHTEKSKQKISESTKGMRSGENNPMCGKQHTEKTREKMSKNHANFSHEKHPRSNPVYCIELNEIFWGATCAQDKYGIDCSAISACCKHKKGYNSAGKHPETNMPLHWKYIYDYTQKDGLIIPGAITLGYITKEEVNNYLDSLRQKGNDINGTMEEE